MTLSIHYRGRSEAYCVAQEEFTLELVDETLRANPAALPEPPARRLALQLLDHVLHEEPAPSKPALQAFHHRRIAAAAADIEAARVSSGAAVWKLYDHGFVVRTKDVTLGFDLTRGYSAGVPAFAVADSVLDRIVDACDVLFISHLHEDHADPHVAARFLAQNKSVVAPPQVLTEEPFHSRITHLPREPHLLHELPVRGGEALLRVAANPGHQGAGTENNHHVVVAPCGFTVAHTGDQGNVDEQHWLDRAHEHYRVDLLLPNSWVPDLLGVVAAYDPRFIIPGHDISHREPYWLSYVRMTTGAEKLLVMTWGERFDVPEETAVSPDVGGGRSTE